MARRILVVEDEMDMRKMLEVRLAARGHEVILVPTAEEALPIMKAQKPDLVLLDLYLPGMDGTELCDIIKADEELKMIPVIFISANPLDIEKKTEEHKADGCIQKPFDPEDLISEIERHFS